jgi:hypothetical protein
MGSVVNKVLDTFLPDVVGDVVGAVVDFATGNVLGGVRNAADAFEDVSRGIKEDSISAIFNETRPARRGYVPHPPPRVVPNPFWGTGGMGSIGYSDRLYRLEEAVIGMKSRVDAAMANFDPEAPDAAIQQLRIQRLMNQEMLLINLLTNIAKTEHEAKMAVVRNLRV